MKQEGGFSAVLCDDSGASHDFLQQFNGLLAPRSRCLDGNWEKSRVYFQVPDTLQSYLSAA